MVNIDIKYKKNKGQVYVRSAFTVDVRVKIYLYNGHEYIQKTDNGQLLEIGKEYFFGHDQFINADNIKVEVWDSSNTAILREVIFRNTTATTKQKICIISPIKNEIDILPFFIDYYLNFVGVDKIIFSDGNSDDGSVEYIKTFGDKTEVIIEDHKEYNELNLMKPRNELWKKYKDEYDWFIIVDADEFLYHPNIKELIAQYKLNGITIPTTFGFEMFSTEFPKFEPGVYLPSLIKNGTENWWLNKYVLFNPKEVNMRYSWGSHHSYAEGNVVQNSDTQLLILHYKYLSRDYLNKKGAYGESRRSEQAIKSGHATHWKTNAEMSDEEYSEIISKGRQILP